MFVDSKVLSLSLSAGQVISAGWDKRVKFWDPRSTSSHGSLSCLGTGVESMSLSELNLMVALKSSVHLYDLRYLDRSVQSKEDLVQIKCVRSNSELEGISAVAYVSSLGRNTHIQVSACELTSSQAARFPQHSCSLSFFTPY